MGLPHGGDLKPMARPQIARAVSKGSELERGVPMGDEAMGVDWGGWTRWVQCSLDAEGLLHVHDFGKFTEQDPNEHGAAVSAWLEDDPARMAGLDSGYGVGNNQRLARERPGQTRAVYYGQKDVQPKRSEIEGTAYVEYRLTVNHTAMCELLIERFKRERICIHVKGLAEPTQDGNEELEEFLDELEAIVGEDEPATAGRPAMRRYLTKDAHGFMALAYAMLMLQEQAGAEMAQALVAALGARGARRISKS